MTKTSASQYQYFERLLRLIGKDGFDKLCNSHVMIVGLGGVGSWAAEALARSAIGRLTLIDFDKVAPSNINRQLNCLLPEVGRLKCEVLAERLRLINPWGQIEPLCETYNPASSEAILSIKPDIILDAIDNITYKCHLLASARRLGLPIITSTGAAGRLNPGWVRVCDLSHTKVDPMAVQVRKKLRKDYGYPGNRSFHIPAVYSEELPIHPLDTSTCNIPEACAPPQPGQAQYEDDDVLEERPCRKAPPYGTISFVTGAFGLTAAAEIVKHLLADTNQPTA